MDSSIPPSDDTPRKRCIGPCNQLLPATTEYFRSQKDGMYGLKSICKECLCTYGQLKRLDVAPDGFKRCPTCPEGQRYHPATTEYFGRHKGKHEGMESICKICRARVEKARVINKTLPPDKKYCAGECGRTLPATKEFFPVKRNRLMMRCHDCTQPVPLRYPVDADYRKGLPRRPKEPKKPREPRKPKEPREPRAREKVTEPREPREPRVILSEEEKLRRKKDYAREYAQRPGVKEKMKAYWQRPDVKAKRRKYPDRNYPNRNYAPYNYSPTREYKLEQKRKRNRKRRARLKEVKGSHTPQQIQEQLIRQNYRCYYAACGFSKFKKRKDGTYIYHMDHTFPISRVVDTDIPANDISYIVLSCRDCNDKKKDKFPWEWPEGGRLL